MRERERERTTKNTNSEEATLKSRWARRIFQWKWDHLILIIFLLFFSRKKMEFRFPPFCRRHLLASFIFPFWLNKPNKLISFSITNFARSKIQTSYKKSLFAFRARAPRQSSPRVMWVTHGRKMKKWEHKRARKNVYCHQSTQRNEATRITPNNVCLFVGWRARAFKQ